MASYVPQPIDTAKISLTPSQTELVERLAENAHDVWAAKRIEDGWKWGQSRDDAKREHPCLIPYKDLPESEKAYDRVMVEQVIKAATALGYKVDK